MKIIGDYDVQNDPRKIVKAITIGELRPLLGQKGILNRYQIYSQVLNLFLSIEQLSVGPGDYEVNVPFGEKSLLSQLNSTTKLSKTR